MFICILIKKNFLWEQNPSQINELREEINRLRQESTEEAAALRETNGNLLEELGRSRATSDELSRLQLDMAASKQAKQELQFQIERLTADLEEARAERAGEQLKVAQEEIKVLKAKNDQLTALVPGLRQKWWAFDGEILSIRATCVLQIVSCCFLTK